MGAVAIVAFWCAVALWVSGYAFMASVPTSGDEVTYTRHAAALANSVHFRHPGFEKTLAIVVENAWFMPGVSAALVPVFLLDPHPSLPTIRLYIAVATFLLWIWSIRQVHSRMGRWFSFPLLFFPPFAVTWQCFSSTAWGDLAAGLLLAAIFARTWSMACRIMSEGVFRLRSVVALELLLTAAIYLRSPTLLVAIAIHISLFVTFLLAGRQNSLATRVVKLTAGAAVLIALIVPWSLGASWVLRVPVVTTTSLPLTFAYTFGSYDKVCFGPCPGGKMRGFLGELEFSRDYARQNGVNVLDVQRQMALHVLEDLTLRDYLAKVRRNMVNYALEPEQFLRRFLSISKFGFDRQSIRAYDRIVAVLTRIVYFPFLIALALVNFLPFRRDLAEQVASLCFKMFTLCLYLQPFVHISHGRYWTSFAPLMGLAAGFLARSAALRVTGEEREAAPTSQTSRRILFAIQVFYIFVTFIIVAAVGLA